MPILRRFAAVYGDGAIGSGSAPGFAEQAVAGCAEARNDAQRCTVTGGGAGVVIHCWPNTSLYSPNTVIPAVRYVIPAGTTRLETAVEAAAR